MLGIFIPFLKWFIPCLYGYFTEINFSSPNEGSFGTLSVINKTVKKFCWCTFGPFLSPMKSFAVVNVQKGTHCLYHQVGWLDTDALLALLLFTPPLFFRVVTHLSDRKRSKTKRRNQSHFETSLVLSITSLLLPDQGCFLPHQPLVKKIEKEQKHRLSAYFYQPESRYRRRWCIQNSTSREEKKK